jgi:chromosome segregation ATPase
MFFKKSKKVNDELQQALQKLREEYAKLKGTIVEWRDHCLQIQYQNDHLRQERDQLRRDLDDSNDMIAEQLRNQKEILQVLKDYNAKMGYH